MNTANLQLEGLLLALSSVLDLLQRKGLVTQAELEDALGLAESNAQRDPQRPTELSPANTDAICFPIRFLRVALAQSAEGPVTFAEIATSVGQTKPER